MAANQLKQSLWFMREILQSGARGISREELCSKWAVSSMNDYPGEEISERTFHRQRRLLEDAFQVTIECSKDGNKRYRLSADDLTPGRPSLLDLVLLRAKEDVDTTSSLKQIVLLLTSGNKLMPEDEAALNYLTAQLHRIPYDYGQRLISSVERGVISHADQAEWDIDYKYYIALWNEATFRRTRQWLSVGLCPDGIYFYIVSDDQDFYLREQRAALIGAGEGVRYHRGYWWHEMKDPSLFCMPYAAVPDYGEIIGRCEYILSLMEKV
ncbi:MAG: hypothetical protein NC418_07925 [Muribaculaceae bacterium]|nr:hypothetical protein [Muribaculaceae bacterium]